MRIAIGVDFELICINNEKDEHTIFQTHNMGIKKAKFDYLLFIHEDVKIHSEDWGKRLIQNLYPTGLQVSLSYYWRF